MPPKCIHELEATVTKKKPHCDKTKKKKAKTKDEKGQPVKEPWKPVSITELTECQKMLVRPLPLHLESLITYFAASYVRKPRVTEETVGEILRQALTDKIVPAGTKEADKDKGPAPLCYCRVCDLVFDSLDAFHEHIGGEDHLYMKEYDSVPFFDDVGEGVTLTRNQILAREFMGPALLEEEEETAIELEEEEGSLTTVTPREPTEEDEEGEEEGEESSACATARSPTEEEDGCEFCSSDDFSDYDPEAEVDVVEVEMEEEPEEAPAKAQVEQKRKTGEEEAKKIKIAAEQLNILEPKLIVEYRLQERPCAECSRIWKEYGSLIMTTTSDLITEFAFRCHPTHPGVALLNVVLECFRGSLETEWDEATRVSSSRVVKFPSKEALRKLAAELENVIRVPPTLGTSTLGVACTENYQVAMHERAGEVRAICGKFMDTCEKRVDEGRAFGCEICRVTLPTSLHFYRHLLSEGHDKKMGQAPTRQSGLINPLCQMVCFNSTLSLLPRKLQKKYEKKEVKRQERVKKDKEREDQKAAAAAEGKKKEREESKSKSKKEKKKAKKLIEEDDDVPVTWALEPVVTIGRRGLPSVRWYPPPPGKTITVIRAPRTASETAAEALPDMW